MQKHSEELATLESLDNGKPYAVALAADVPLVRCVNTCGTRTVTAK